MTLQTIRSEWTYWATSSGKIQLWLARQQEQRLRHELAQLPEVKPTPAARHVDCIVSLTTWHRRLDVLPLTLLTLVNQTVRPNKIIIWITSEDYALLDPATELKFGGAGVEFAICENFGPHKKWLFTRALTGDPRIVLADDDIFYPPYWLENLMRQAGETVCTAHRCHRILVDEKGEVRPYSTWLKSIRQYGRTSHSFLATNGAGVVFRPSWIPADFYNVKLIRNLCPTADDIWLKCAFLAAGIRVRKSADYIPILGALESQESALERTNVHEDRNTSQLIDTLRYFDIPRHLLIDGLHD